MSAATALPLPPEGDLLALGAPSVSDGDFLRFQRLIEKEAGIFLSDAKRSLLVGRLARRLRVLNLPNLTEYYKRVVADPAELTCMIDHISTNETQFFREPVHFDFMEREIFSEWTARAASGERSRKIRVWSAGCSSGEEPYSLAMTLLYHFPVSAGWQIDILATDISTRVLAKARAGIWPLEKSKQIPAPYLKQFMLRGTGEQEGKMKAGPEIQRLIRFEQFNLLESRGEANPGRYDLILCRNVLIYFQPETKVQVVRRLLHHLSPDGYFFVGHSESLHHLTDTVRSVVPTIYVPTGRS